MYIDRWENNHNEFVYSNFHKLILSHKRIYALEKEDFSKTMICQKLQKLINEKSVGTDEAILQNLGNTGVRLCRPLFGILENTIIEYFKTQNILFNESECIITNFRNKEKLTPRELVQYELLRDAPESLLRYLLELARLCINEEGFLKYNVRNNRRKLLGNSYKSEKIDITKILQNSRTPPAFLLRSARHAQHDKFLLCASAIRRRHIRWGIESRH